MAKLPPTTLGLLVALALGYALQMWLGAAVFESFALWPLPAAQAETAMVPGFHVWQLVTYSLLHGNHWHILMNAFALWMFGPAIERLLGAQRFLGYWMACVVGAGLMQLVTGYWQAEAYPTIGASGGVFGVLLAFGMFYPHQRILLLLPPIPMPAWLFVTLYGALELFLGVTRTQSGVAHFAHLGGMFTGLLLVQYWRGRLPVKPRSRLRR